MNDIDIGEFSPLNLGRLLNDTITVTLDTQERSAFFEWLDAELPRYVTDAETSRNPELIRALSANLGRVFWNAIPLPRLGFRADTIPEPGRNDPCLCGSGRKYKHCCLRAPQMPAIDEAAIWPLLLPKLNEEQRKAAFTSRRVPIPAVTSYAEEMVKDGREKEAIELLEFCIEPAFAVADERSAVLIDALANAYDEVMDEEAKVAFLQRATALPKPSALRAEAWARLATIEMDGGNSAAAWHAYARARGDWPKSPALPYLEISLLLGDARHEEARNRARKLLNKLLREGTDEGNPRLAFLEQVVENPDDALHSTLIYEYEDESDTGPSPLRNWLDDMAERPVPTYSIMPDEVPPSDLFPPTPRAGYLACGELRDVETRWREVFDLEKPFSIQDTPANEGDIWSQTKSTRWLNFLEEHAEAFDSIDILDDLATALTLHPDADSASYEEDLLCILHRVRNIVAAAQSPDIHFYWVSNANRPALRSIFRLHGFAERDDEEEFAMECASWLLRLNPHDNHGSRCWLVNQHLIRSENNQALEIAEQFDKDYFAETRYGRVLALHRLGREKEAQAVLATAYRDLPKVACYLVQDEVEEPELHEFGTQPGGDDQAWLYREDMRDVWLATPGAIDLLKSVAES